MSYSVWDDYMTEKNIPPTQEAIQSKANKQFNEEQEKQAQFEYEQSLTEGYYGRLEEEIGNKTVSQNFNSVQKKSGDEDGFFKNVADGFRRSGYDIMEGIGGALKVGSNQEGWLYKQGENLTNYSQKKFEESDLSSDYEGNWQETVGQMAGGILSVVGTAGALAVGGASSLVVGAGAGLAGGILAAGDMYNRAVNKGLDHNQASLTASVSGMVEGALNMVTAGGGSTVVKGASNLIKKASQKIGSKYGANLGKVIGKNIVVRSGGEAFEGFSQQVLDNAMIKAYNEDQELFENVGQQMVMRAGMGAGFHAIGSMQKRKITTPESNLKQESKNLEVSNNIVKKQWEEGVRSSELKNLENSLDMSVEANRTPENIKLITALNDTRNSLSLETTPNGVESPIKVFTHQLDNGKYEAKVLYPEGGVENVLNWDKKVYNNKTDAYLGQVRRVQEATAHIDTPENISLHKNLIEISSADKLLTKNKQYESYKAQESKLQYENARDTISEGITAQYGLEDSKRIKDILTNTKREIREDSKDPIWVEFQDKVDDIGAFMKDIVDADNNVRLYRNTYKNLSQERRNVKIEGNVKSKNKKINNKFSKNAFTRLKKGNSNTISKLSDVVTGTKTKKALEDVLGTPIKFKSQINLPDNKTKAEALYNSKDDTIYLNHSEIKGMSDEKLARVILEEAIHAKQSKDGINFESINAYDDFGRPIIDMEKYKNLSYEQKAKKLVDDIMNIDETEGIAFSLKEATPEQIQQYTDTKLEDNGYEKLTKEEVKEIELPEATPLEVVRTFAQDKNVYLKTLDNYVRKEYEKTGKNYSYSENSFWENIEHIERINKGFTRKTEALFIDNVYKKMIDDGINPDMLDLYRQSKNAPRANAEMKQRMIDEGKEGIDGLSGMTNEQALKNLKMIEEKGLTGKLDEYSQFMIKEQEKAIRQNIEPVDGKEVADMYIKKLKEGHVSLYRKVGKNQTTGSAGITTKGQFSKKAYGNKDLEVQDTTISTIQNIVGMEHRKNKNDFGILLKDMLEEVPELKGVYKIRKGDATPKIVDGKIVVDENGEPVFDLRDSKDTKFGFRIEGQQYYIDFKGNKDFENMFKISDVSNLTKSLEKVLLPLAKINEYTRVTNTDLSWKFGPRNAFKDNVNAKLILDPIAKSHGIKDAQIKGIQKYVNPKTFKESHKRSWKYVKGNGDAGMVRFADDLGGAQGHTMIDHDSFGKKVNDLKRSSVKYQKNIESDGLKKGAKVTLASTITGFKKVADVISAHNTSLELATRNMYYEGAIKAGVDPKIAIALASDITLNFGRGGTAKGVYKYLGNFYGAAIQGLEQAGMVIGAGIKNPKILAKVVGVPALIGTLESIMGIAIDEDGYDAQSYYAKYQNMNIPLQQMLGVETHNFINLPSPYGIFGFFNALPKLTIDVFRGKLGVAEYFGKVIGSSFFNFNPFGGFIPMAKGMYELATNTHWAGGDIVTPSPFEKIAEPNSSYQSDYTKGISENISNLLNNVTGGDIEFDEKGKYIKGGKSGFLDFHPLKVKYALNVLGGGAGRTVSDTSDLISNIKRGELSFKNSPLGQLITKEGNLTWYYSATIKDAIKESSRNGVSPNKKLEVVDFVEKLKVIAKEEDKNTDLKRYDAYITDLLKGQYNIQRTISEEGYNKYKEMLPSDKKLFLQYGSDKLNKYYNNLENKNK